MQQVHDPTTTTTTTTDNARLTTLLLSVLPRVGRRVGSALRDGGHPSQERLRALYKLRQGPLRVTDLACAWQVSMPSVSRILDVLADEGLVTRHDDPADRRVVRVAITLAGAETLAAAEEAAQRSVAELLQPLSTRQRERLATALAELEALLEADGSARGVAVPR